MADDLTVSTSGGPAQVATDEIGGKHYQRVKVTYGGDGSASDVASDNPLPVSATISALPLPNGAATQAGQDAVAAAISATVTELPHQPSDAVSDLTYAYQSRSTTGTTSIVAGVASQTTRLHRMILNWAGACTVEIVNGAGTSLFKLTPTGAGFYDTGYCERPLCVTPTNSALQLKTTGAVAVEINAYTKTS